VEIEDVSITTLLSINKSQSTYEPFHKGVVSVPSQTVRPSEVNDSRHSTLNTTKRLRSKRKNKTSMMDKQLMENIEVSQDYMNMMNSNRIIEPFSPTFEHPEDVLPSNQTSFRPQAMSKYNRYNKNIQKDDESTLAPTVMFNDTDRLEMQNLRCECKHNRTQSSNADTTDFDRFKKSKELEEFKETGKFANPLSDSSQMNTKRKSATRKLGDSKETTRKNKYRSKTGNGRYSRRGKRKNKSEERSDTQRIFSKSVDQSYHLQDSSIYPHDESIAKKLAKIREEGTPSYEDLRHSLISPHAKINKLIKESLKKK
jgi:hypothetical protein